MAEALPRVPDEETVQGWAWYFRYAYGALAPLKFSEISYGGKVPTDDSGLTFRMILKLNRSDSDNDSILDVNSGFNISTEPLELGFLLNMGALGVSPGATLFGELWVEDTDPSYGTQLIVEFQLGTSQPLRKGFQ